MVHGLDFEFDPKDNLYVRIDRRRKAASIDHSACTNKTTQDLDIFFEKVNFEVKDQTLMMELVPERLRGETATFRYRSNGKVYEKRSSYHCSSHPSTWKDGVEFH